MNKYIKWLIIAIVIALGAYFIFNSPVEASSKKVNICHKTSSKSNPYNALQVADDGHWNGHDEHDGDFLYEGKTKKGKPTNKNWCKNNVPVEEPEYGWTEWSECSAKCDGGTQTRECVQLNDVKCDDKPKCEGDSIQRCNTQACEVPSTTRMCHWDGEGFEAIAVTETARTRHFNAHELDKDWETGMDKYCEVEEEPTPDPEPREEPKNTFKEDTRCNDAKPKDITWLDIADGSNLNDWHPEATWSAEGGDTIEVRFSDDRDNLKWRFEMSNDGHESLGFMDNTGMLGMVDYYYQFRTVNGCSKGNWTELTKAFN